MASENWGFLTNILARLGLINQRIQVTPGSEPPYRLRTDFLTPSEALFFQLVKSMLPEQVIICPKVYLADLFSAASSESYPNSSFSLDGQMVDFLVYDPKKLKPVFAIDLDDSPPPQRDSSRRDQFIDQIFSIAGLPLIRVPARQAYNMNELSELIQKALQR